jgi:tRNA/tmRNA/rRNA uracil-C5-methylase (TrmA/RlmC/RlmD family)
VTSAGGGRRPRRHEPSASAPSLVGAEWEVEVGPVAHGGFCIARHEGQVVFVRHALPGERVLARVTEGRVGDRFVRADAVSVSHASPHRVVPPCPWSGPGRCGGCDFQHVDLPEQRALKAAVVREQFSRLAGLDVDVEVAAVPGDHDGLDWRTRVEFAVDGSGRAGLRRHRSRDVVPVEDCLIATRPVVGSGVLDRSWPGVAAVDVIDAADPAEPVLVPVPLERAGGRARERSRPQGRDRRGGDRRHRGPQPDAGGDDADDGGLVREVVRDGDWSGEYTVAARGFWQVHPGAAPTFLHRVSVLLGAAHGDRVLDLYAGSGLFTARLGELVGPDGIVLGIEGDRRAVENGRANTGHLPNVEWRAGRVDAELATLVDQGVGADLAVLDPPRTGAGPDVIAHLAALGVRRAVYVACDPAALARDVATALTHGYRLVSLEAHDAFPMTHHVECIAVLERAD